MGFFKDIYEGRSWFYGDAIKRIKEDINLLYGIGVLLNKKPEISQFLTIEHYIELSWIKGMRDEVQSMEKSEDNGVSLREEIIKNIERNGLKFDVLKRMIDENVKVKDAFSFFEKDIWNEINSDIHKLEEKYKDNSALFNIALMEYLSANALNGKIQMSIMEKFSNIHIFYRANPKTYTSTIQYNMEKFVKRKLGEKTKIEEYGAQHKFTRFQKHVLEVYKDILKTKGIGCLSFMIDSITESVKERVIEIESNDIKNLLIELLIRAESLEADEEVKEIDKDTKVIDRINKYIKTKILEYLKSHFLNNEYYSKHMAGEVGEEEVEEIESEWGYKSIVFDEPDKIASNIEFYKAIKKRDLEGIKYLLFFTKLPKILNAVVLFLNLSFVSARSDEYVENSRKQMILDEVWDALLKVAGTQAIAKQEEKIALAKLDNTIKKTEKHERKKIANTEHFKKSKILSSIINFYTSRTKYRMLSREILKSLRFMLGAVRKIERAEGAGENKEVVRNVTRKLGTFAKKMKEADGRFGIYDLLNFVEALAMEGVDGGGELRSNSKMVKKTFYWRLKKANYEKKHSPLLTDTEILRSFIISKTTDLLNLLVSNTLWIENNQDERNVRKYIDYKEIKEYLKIFHKEFYEKIDREFVIRVWKFVLGIT